jgi:hypothetical protein
LALLLFATVALTTRAPPVVTTAYAGDDARAAQGANDGARTDAETRKTNPGTMSDLDRMCWTIAGAAAANELPVTFFMRLIWQESHFNPHEVSRAGAQGVAQFMPATARLRGLENPFDPIEAIAKSAELLRDLRREFGNLGLAAAAYNAGPKRVRDWLDSRRPLPGETRAYLRIITGRPAEEWAGGQKDVVGSLTTKDIPCNEAVASLVPGYAVPLAPPKAQPVNPWGVELVGGLNQTKALEAYRRIQAKYSMILADRQPFTFVKGVIGEMGAVRVRVGAETRMEANKLCAEVRAAGGFCEVLRN